MNERTAPRGKFIVIGWDQFSYEDYTIAIHDTIDDAILRAEIEAKDAVERATPDMVDTIFVYDDQGEMRKRISAHD